jgi:transcriptional regulator with XRE-family HTH domain
LAEQLKSARTKAGLSLRELTALTKIPATTIEGYEAGNKIPAHKFLLLADALDHHEFSVDDDQYTVMRLDKAPIGSRTPEQLKLNFSGEYNYSKASIRISPGRITVLFDGAKVSVPAKVSSR